MRDPIKAAVAALQREWIERELVKVPFEDVQLWTTRLLVEIEGTGTQLPPKPDFDAANRLLAELREAAL